MKTAADLIKIGVLHYVAADKMPVVQSYEPEEHESIESRLKTFIVKTWFLKASK